MSKVKKINSSSSAAPSEAMLGAYGEPRNKLEEDSCYEMGVKLSMEDSEKKAISTDVCDSSDTSYSEEESTRVEPGVAGCLKQQTFWMI